MNESVIYQNVASELLEIFKYLDKELKEKIPEKLKESLERITNKEHNFKIDKTKELNEQNILPQTKQVLSIIYLKYCCSSEEANKIIEENYNIQKQKEIEKREKYNPDNIFKKNERQIEENIQEQVQLIPIENMVWYKKIALKISTFIKNIFRK